MGNDPGRETVSPLLGQLQEQAEASRRWLKSRLAGADDGVARRALASVELHTAVVLGVLRGGESGVVHYIASTGAVLPALIATLVVSGHVSPEVFDQQGLAGFPWQVIPGVEVIASPSGQGLSYGLGIALARRLDGQQQRVFVLLREHEVEEGQVWEAAMAAAHFRVGNLIALVPRQAPKVGAEDPLARRWRAFGWDVYGVKGDDMAQLLEAVHNTEGQQRHCPTAILAVAESEEASPQSGRG